MNPYETNKLNDKYFDEFVKLVRTKTLIKEAIKSKKNDRQLCE